VSQVNLTGITTPAGFDGIIFGADGTLYVVAGVINVVYAIKSEDEWETATVVAQVSSNIPDPSTAALRQSDLYLLHARFNTPTGLYEIEKITFGMNQIF
jgi:hypothetical protein